MPPEAPTISDAAAELEKELTPSPIAPDPKAGEPAAAEPAAGAKPADKPDEDPEIDLGGDLGKVKRSSIASWKKNGMLEEDYRKKTEEISAQKQELEALANMSDFLTKHPKKLAKVLAVIEEAEDAAAAAAGGTGTAGAAAAAGKDAKDAITAILEKMDPEDPASVLLKEIYTELKSVRSTVTGFEQREKDMKAAQEKADQEAQAAATAKANKDSFEDLKKTVADTMAEIAPAQKFDTEIENQIWRDLSHKLLMKNMPKEGFVGPTYKEDFVKAIKAAATEAAKSVKAIGEARLKKHLESKGGPILPGPGASGDVAPKAVTMENLQEALESELTARDKEAR